MEYALATGNTYPNRRTLRGIGGVFDYAESGYWLPSDKADAARALDGITVELVEREENPLRELTPDELRSKRQERIDRKRARLLDRADRAERRSNEAYNRISPHERDFLRLGEPVKIGHHSERRHRNLIDRVDRSMEKCATEAKYADDLRRRADWMMDARVKGDKERQRDAIREKVRSEISIGDKVSEPIFGVGVVVKMFKKSAQIKVESGQVHTAPIHWLRLIEKGIGVAPESVRMQHRFKVGDVCNWRGPAGCWTNAVQVRVLRRNPKGYTIEHPGYGSGPRKDIVREYDLIAIEKAVA